MYSAMNIADVLITEINTNLEITKFISWNEMHQKSPEELIKSAKMNMGDEIAMSTADWCFDINTFNALSALLKYAEENNEGVIISYEYCLAIICKSKDVLKEVLRKLPQAIKNTCQCNMTNVEIYDESCVVSYYNKQVQLPFATRPKYIYKLITNTYE